MKSLSSTFWYVIVNSVQTDKISGSSKLKALADGTFIMAPIIVFFYFNCLPYDKIFDQSKLKGFADHVINVT